MKSKAATRCSKKVYRGAGYGSVLVRCKNPVHHGVSARETLCAVHAHEAMQALTKVPSKAAEK